MLTKSFVAAFAIAAFVTPVRADVPDGHGGRTSPTGLLNKKAEAVAAVHACCDKPNAHKARLVATRPAELKAMGHLSWVSRANDPKPAMACAKRVPVAPAAYRSSAEAKALGHLAGRSATTVTAGAQACCATPSCPMHPIS